MRIHFLSYCFLLLAFSSCISVSSTPDGDYYNIGKADIFLVKKSNKDSLIYDVDNVTEGTCKLLEVIDSLSNDTSIGIMLRFEADRNNNANYGPYEEGGLIDKVKNIAVSFEDSKHKKEITSLLIGDSTISFYKWRNEEYEGRPNVNHVTSNDCNETYYHPTISSLIKMGNEYKMNGESIVGNDYFFWMEKNFIKTLPFKPKMLILKVETINSKTKLSKQLVDTFLIKNNL